jgi:hypothetical protein
LQYIPDGQSDWPVQTLWHATPEPDPSSMHALPGGHREVSQPTAFALEQPAAQANATSIATAATKHRESHDEATEESMGFISHARSAWFPQVGLT